MLLHRLNIATLLLLTLLPSAASAQMDLRFNGYVLDMPIYQRFDPDLAALFNTSADQYLNLTRLRLRPVLYLNDNNSLHLEYELLALAGSEQQSFNGELTTPRRQAVDLQWQPVEEEHITMRHFIDRLFYKANFSFGQLVLGRQRISLGSGRIWNPTDVFNPVNPAAFTKIEKDGADALTFKTYFGNFTDLLLVVNAENEFNNYNAAARFRTNVATYDLALLAGRADKRMIVGGELAGNLFTAGLRAELLYSLYDEGRGEDFLSFVIGADYQFNDAVYGLIEYHFNGAGAADPRDYNLAALLNGDLLNLGRHYLALQGSWQLHPLFVVSAVCIGNFTDGSGFVSLSGQYSLSNEASLGAGLQLSAGSRDGLAVDEYRLFPSAAFLQFQVYF